VFLCLFEEFNHTESLRVGGWGTNFCLSFPVKAVSYVYYFPSNSITLLVANILLKEIKTILHLAADNVKH
jgi:hypothetical protein